MLSSRRAFRRQAVLLSPEWRCKKEGESSSSSSSSSSSEEKASSSSTDPEKPPPEDGLGLVEAAVKRLEALDKSSLASAPLEKGVLENEWWRLAQRRKRRPTVLGKYGTSLYASYLARWSGLLEDGRFSEGASAALERVHELMAKDDAKGLETICDLPLAKALEKALEEKRTSGYDIFHGCEVLRPPVISWWRVFVGVERSEAKWVSKVEDDGTQTLEVKQDLMALDARKVAGFVVVLPKHRLKNLENELRKGTSTASINAIYSIMVEAHEKHTVSLQAVVDFPRVREALVAFRKKTNEDDPLTPQDLWPGSTDGFVYTARQLTFEAPTYRVGTAVNSPTWTLIDIDNIVNGGAPFWKTSIEAVL